MKQPRETGFTLLEVLVSITILALVSASIGPTFHHFFRVNSQMERRTAAIAAAQQMLDNLRFTNPENLPTSGTGSTETVTISQYTFAVTPEFCTVSMYCTGTSTRHISVSVNFAGNVIYELETVYTALR